MEKEKKKGFVWIPVLSVLGVTLLIAFWQWKAPFLIDNDNIYLKTVVSGEMTGTPEPHMYYMGILSGWFLSTLYRITGNGIPWFGLFLCAAMGIPMVLFLSRSLKACGNPWAKAVVALLYVLVYCTFFYCYFAKTQYTIATGMVGVGALFLLALLQWEESLGKYLLKSAPFLILTAWSMGMRDKGFFMLLPFFGMTFLAKIFVKDWRKVWKNVVLLGCVFAALMLVIFLGNRLAYSGSDWKEFRDYTDASEILFDFDGFPDYDSHADFYEERGITRTSFEAMTKHYNILLDPAINRENMMDLAELAEEERLARQESVPRKFLNVLVTIVKRNLVDYVDRPLNILVFLLYFFAAVMAILGKKWKAVLEIAFIIVARMFDWIYLAWYGRTPFRVTQIVYLAELALLLAVILNYRLWEIGTWKKKIAALLPIGMAAVIAFAGLRFGLPVMKNHYAHIQGLRTMSVCFPELEAYLEAHPDNFYYFDMSHLYYMEDTLAFHPSKYENYVYMGSWMPNSPWYNGKMEAFGITDVAGDLIQNEHVFLIYQEVDFDTREFLDAYFSDHFPGTKMDVMDVFESSNGFRYEILKPIREIKENETQS